MRTIMIITERMSEALHADWIFMDWQWTTYNGLCDGTGRFPYSEHPNTLNISEEDYEALVVWAYDLGFGEDDFVGLMEGYDCYSCEDDYKQYKKKACW